MVRSWGRSEVGSAPSSDLVRSWGKTCGWKMGQPGLKTSTPSSDWDLVRRWGRLVLRPGRSEDGAQHYHNKVCRCIRYHNMLIGSPLLCIHYNHQAIGMSVVPHLSTCTIYKRCCTNYQLIVGAPIYKWCSTNYQYFFAPFINGAAPTINTDYN